MQRTRLVDRESFITADGSSIRELAGIPSGNAVNQSLAEATVPPGGETIEHYHRVSEEIYFFTSGAGRMRLGDEEDDVRAGDTVVIAPGIAPQAVERGPGAARAAVLLLARVLARRHRPAVKALLAVLVALLAAPATAAAAIPTIGIGEQHPQLFTQQHFHELGVRHVRFIASWDAFKSDWQRAELDGYMQAARAANVKVLLGFGRSRDPQRTRKLPSLRAYEREFKKFRARYPDVDEFIAWNEANHCSQPTCRNPGARRSSTWPRAGIAAAARSSARACSTARTWPSGRRTSRRPRAPERRIIWGLHNYIDANLFRTKGTRALLKAVKGDVWFTETGGIVKRNNDSTLKFPESTRNAAKATTFVFKLAALSPRVKRVYFYHWAPAPTTLPTWDSALVDRRGAPASRL